MKIETGLIGNRTAATNRSGCSPPTGPDRFFSTHTMERGCGVARVMPPAPPSALGRVGRAPSRLVGAQPAPTGAGRARTWPQAPPTSYTRHSRPLLRPRSNVKRCSCTPMRAAIRSTSLRKLSGCLSERDDNGRGETYNPGMSSTRRPPTFLNASRTSLRMYGMSHSGKDA